MKFNKRMEEQYNNIKEKTNNEYIPRQYFSYDGFLEMIEFLEANPGADKIPSTLWVSKNEEIVMDKKYWLFMSETLKNFQKTIFSGLEKEFNNLLNRVKKINPDLDF